MTGLNMLVEKMSLSVKCLYNQFLTVSRSAIHVYPCTDKTVINFKGLNFI